MKILHAYKMDAIGSWSSVCVWVFGVCFFFLRCTDSQDCFEFCSISHVWTLTYATSNLSVIAFNVYEFVCPWLMEENEQDRKHNE